MGRATQFFYVLLGFIAGVVLQSLIPLPVYSLYVGALICGCCYALAYTSRYRVAPLILLFILLGMLRMALTIPDSTDQHISFFNGQTITFEGVVHDEPDVRTDQVKYTISNIYHNGLPLRGRLLLSTDRYPRYGYGDRLEVTCSLRAPVPIEEFAYDMYLARYGIYSLCYRPKSVIVLQRGNGNPLKSALLYFKEEVLEVINHVLPEPHASLLSGILIGARQSISDEVQEDFRRTGTAHIVAVSGYNVSIIAVFVLGILMHAGLSRKQAFWIVVAFLFCFMLMTGAQASIIRATGMGVLVLWAKQIGRLSAMRNILALTAAGMLAGNPLMMRYDVGFQLSFAATIGLVYMTAPLERLLRIERLGKHAVTYALKSYLVPTLAAICATAPIMIVQFKSFSVIAPFANLLILPVIPASMLLGFCMVILGMVWAPAGLLFGWCAWLLLSYMLRVLQLCSALPWAQLSF